MTIVRLAVGETLGAVGLPGDGAMAPSVSLAFALAISRLGGRSVQAD